MSTHDGPSKRRRIAGESKPGDAPAPAPARKVVKKPVARPGGPAVPAADDDAVQAASAPTTSEPTTSEPAPTDAAPTSAEPDAVSGVADTQESVVAAPRIAPRIARRKDRGVEPEDDEQATTLDGPGDAAAVVDESTEQEPDRAQPDLARLALVALTVGALVFGAFFGYRGFVEWRATHGVDGAHEQAAETAASAAETIFSYRYDQLEQYVENSEEVMTPSFAKDFKTISPALNDLAPQRKIQVKATTRDAAPLGCGNDCRRDEAQVLVFVDQARLADGSDVPTVFGNRVRLSMVERDGRWLVDDIKAL